MELEIGLAVLSSCIPNGCLPVGNMIQSDPTQSLSCQKSLKSGYFQHCHLHDLACQAWLQKYLCQYNTWLSTEAKMSLLRTMTAKKGQGVLQCHPDASMYQIGKCRTFSFFFFFF